MVTEIIFFVQLKNLPVLQSFGSEWNLFMYLFIYLLNVAHQFCFFVHFHGMPWCDRCFAVNRSDSEADL